MILKEMKIYSNDQYDVLSNKVETVNAMKIKVPEFRFKERVIIQFH